jgi:V-type H+-transporting ATPase subunit H
MEEILGLGDKDDVNSDAYGMKHSNLFILDTPGGGNTPTPQGRKIADVCFARALTFSDIYLQKSASMVFASLLTVHEGNVSALLTWITTKVTSTAPGVWDMALPVLCILTHTSNNKAYLLNNHIVMHIVSILKRLGVNGNSQQLYELVFVLWSLSLGATDPSTYLHNNVIATVVELLAASPSRKVTRMCISLLRQLADTHDHLVLNELYTAGVMRIIDNLSGNSMVKQMNDLEVENDFKALQEVLAKNYRELSSFERWSSEVESGTLRWGILHTEKFWKDNAKFVEMNNFGLLRTLISHLNSADMVRLPVCCVWVNFPPDLEI